MLTKAKMARWTSVRQLPRIRDAALRRIIVRDLGAGSCDRRLLRPNVRGKRATTSGRQARAMQDKPQQRGLGGLPVALRLTEGLGLATRNLLGAGVTTNSTPELAQLGRQRFQRASECIRWNHGRQRETD